MIRIFIFIIIFFKSTIGYSENNIVYIDVQYIIDNSKLGKFYSDQLKIIKEKRDFDLNAEALIIKKKETELNNQKNIIKKEELNNKIKELNKLVKNFRNNKQLIDQEIQKEKKNYSNKILSTLNPILTSYADQNNIKLVLEKKNILVGIKTLDITNEILNLLNKKTNKEILVNEN